MRQQPLALPRRAPTLLAAVASLRSRQPSHAPRPCPRSPLRQTHRPPSRCPTPTTTVLPTATRPRPRRPTSAHASMPPTPTAPRSEATAPATQTARCSPRAWLSAEALLPSHYPTRLAPRRQIKRVCSSDRPSERPAPTPLPLPPPPPRTPATPAPTRTLSQTTTSSTGPRPTRALRSRNRV